MLKITNLRKSYKKFEVLKGINMTIEKGTVYGFLGRNGCGKTTTMNIICNVVAKDSGKIEFGAVDGQNVNNSGEDSVTGGGGWNSVAKVKEEGRNPAPKIGYLTETPALYNYMNGYEYLRYIAACANYSGDIEKRVSEVLDLTGMSEGATRRIKGYSRGMNQRLGIAASIFDNPQLLILDEPTSALDPEGRAEVMNVIRNLKQSGVTIILCTHIITDVERVADKVGIMRDGMIVEEDTIDNVFAKYKSQNSDITVKLAAPDVQNSIAIRQLPLVGASDYNHESGTVVIGTIPDNIDELYFSLMALINEKKIRITQLTSQNVTLEDVYFMITGLSGRT